MNMSCETDGKFFFDSCPTLTVPVYPTKDNISAKDAENNRYYDFGRVDSFTKINHYYDSEEKCAILAFPYMSISFHLAETKRIPEEDKQLMRDIIKLTPRPHFIRNAVTEFIEKVQIFLYLLLIVHLFLIKKFSTFT